jgi:hypothetical protein
MNLFANLNTKFNLNLYIKNLPVYNGERATFQQIDISVNPHCSGKAQRKIPKGINIRMTFIYSLRCDFELIISTKDAASLRDVDVRLALFFRLRHRLGLTKVGYKVRSGDYRTEVGRRA